ncbi:hypothetical protein L596_009988 [Steinernema carpocapsae]|uniref:Uncharacterized protein n=1 Tax=Steinernema carpocapsae TaxID=34508 RepID=A0A4U5PH62_STECR|nr:hypothetical protein L596_009988 [Steinernema carpocapsae]
MLYDWSEMKNKVVDGLVALHDEVFEPKLADPEGLVKKLVEKHLPRRATRNASRAPASPRGSRLSLSPRAKRLPSPFEGVCGFLCKYK